MVYLGSYFTKRSPQSLVLHSHILDVRISKLFARLTAFENDFEKFASQRKLGLVCFGVLELASLAEMLSWAQGAETRIVYEPESHDASKPAACPNTRAHVPNDV
jgi:hypothetical protein